LNLSFWFRTSFRGIKSDVFGMYKPEMHNYFHHRDCKGPSLIFLATPEKWTACIFMVAILEKDGISNRTNLR
jgi:hypothetical protein